MAPSSDGSLINATNNITSNNNLLSNVNTIVMMVGHNPAIERLLNNLLLSPSKSHEASKQSWHDISIKRGYVWCDWAASTRVIILHLEWMYYTTNTTNNRTNNTHNKTAKLSSGRNTSIDRHRNNTPRCSNGDSVHQDFDWMATTSINQRNLTLLPPLYYIRHITDG